MAFDRKTYAREYYREYRKRPERQEYERRWRSENKEHCNAYARQWAKDNRPKKRETEKRQRVKVRAEVLAHYGGVCACCGEHRQAFLAIDHIKGKGNQHRKSLGRQGSMFHRWLKSQGFPEGYRVLCHNCNWAIGVFGTCPHEEEKANAA